MSTINTSYDHWKPVIQKQGQSLFEPLRWVREGWRVLVAAPGVSAALGLAFTGLCYAAYTAANALPLFSAAFLTLLLAVSPFLAAAGYSAAMQVAKGRKPTLASCARTVANRALSIGTFAIVCGLIMAAWVRLTGLAFALYYGTLGPDRSEVARVWVSGNAPADMVLFIGIATGLLAAALFTVAVYALPRIVHRNCDAIQAVIAGVRAIGANPLPVAAWSVVLLMIIGVALLSQLLLMPLVFPILAYATWFGYAALASEEAPLNEEAEGP
jgi:uncharacterized membrane protein